MTRAAVVGCGIMGSGITFVARAAGFPVTAVEPTDELVAAARERVERHEAQARKRNAELGELAPLEMTTDLATAVAAADVVVEAVPEDLDLKRDVFGALGAAAGDDTVIASNTSGLSIEALGSASGRSSQVVGLHFFNPVPVLPLVELISTLVTNDDAVARVETFASDVLGKKVVRCGDRSGFIVNALLVPYLLSAIRMAEAGVATVEDIDTAIVAGLSHPMGPLRLSDLIGLDTMKLIADSMYDEYKDPNYAPPPLLLRMVEAGRLGKKSGKGFYSY